MCVCLYTHLCLSISSGIRRRAWPAGLSLPSPGPSSTQVPALPPPAPWQCHPGTSRHRDAESHEHRVGRLPKDLGSGDPPGQGSPSTDPSGDPGSGDFTSLQHPGPSGSSQLCERDLAPP